MTKNKQWFFGISVLVLLSVVIFLLVRFPKFSSESIKEVDFIRTAPAQTHKVINNQEELNELFELINNSQKKLTGFIGFTERPGYINSWMNVNNAPYLSFSHDSIIYKNFTYYVGVEVIDEIFKLYENSKEALLDYPS